MTAEPELEERSAAPTSSPASTPKGKPSGPVDGREPELAINTAARSPIPEAANPPNQWVMHQATTTADKATKLPTERSIPAVMITMVIPIAMMAMTAI